ERRQACERERAGDDQRDRPSGGRDDACSKACDLIDPPRAWRSTPEQSADQPIEMQCGGNGSERTGDSNGCDGGRGEQISKQ
ncbi:hypothetical protein QP271_25260, partial [Escherichia coli]|nr:hypothetical protein [Escherichia coli]